MTRTLLFLLLAAVLPAYGGPATAPTAGQGSPAKQLTALPPGTTLPIRLDRTLHAGHTPAGTTFQASTTQRIPLGAEIFLPADNRVNGKVLASAPGTLTLSFDCIVFAGHALTISTSTAAVATFIVVAETHEPASTSTDRGNSDPASWTTAQVGGDQVARSGWSGPLVNGATQVIGSADYWGVYALPAAPGLPPRALGPFSSDAAGLFGFPADCGLTAASPTISCVRSRLTLRRGDVLLLRVK